MPKNYGGKLPVEDWMDNFDPNVEPEGDWATFIPRWRGAFHVHKSRADALRAITPRIVSSGILYKRQPWGWLEIHRHDARDVPPEQCEMCGHQPKPSTLWEVLTPRWLKARGGRAMDPLRVIWLCGNCVRRNG